MREILSKIFANKRLLSGKKLLFLAETERKIVLSADYRDFFLIFAAEVKNSRDKP